jgi:putative Holliday junction resolvase
MLWDELNRVINTEAIGTIVVGLPRGLEGQETEQTRICREFAAELGTRTEAEIVLQDEALTSEQAKREFAERGHWPKSGDLDALAAVYILEDYLQQQS